MPQARAAEQTQEDGKIAPEVEFPFLGDADATPGTPAWLIAKAEELERDKNDIGEEVDANRVSLRNLDKQGGLDAEQKAWLATFYPQKVKGDEREKTEVEATRRSHLAARKRG